MISSESFVLNFLKVYNVTDMNSTSYRDVFYSILTSIHLCSGSEHFRYIPVLCGVWKGLWGWGRKQPMTVYDCAEGNLPFRWFAENDYVHFTIFSSISIL